MKFNESHGYRTTVDTKNWYGGKEAHELYLNIEFSDSSTIWENGTNINNNNREYLNKNFSAEL